MHSFCKLYRNISVCCINNLYSHGVMVSSLDSIVSSQASSKTFYSLIQCVSLHNSTEMAGIRECASEVN